MRPILYLAAVLLLIVPVQANAQSWGEDGPPATVDAARDPPAESFDADLRAAATDVAARSRLTIKQRRAMNITIPNIMRKMVAMHKDGSLAGKDTGLVAIDILDQLVTDNPKAFADPALDWDAVMEWVEYIVKILLAIMMFLS